MAPILNRLLAMKNDDTSPKEVKFFFEKCYSIGLATIKKRYAGEKNIFIGSDISCENLATDAIAHLFIKRMPNEPIGLIKSLNNWHKSIDSEAEAMFFLNSVIWSRISQFMTEMLKSSDPFFSKIYVSMKYFAKKNNFKKVVYFGITYFIPNTYAVIDGPVIEKEEIENLPNKLFYGNFDDIISNIYHYLVNSTEYFPALPINATVKKIKHVIGSEQYLITKSNENPYFDEILDINKIVNDSMEKIFLEIEQTDIKEQGMDESAKPQIYLALKDISEDIKNGGIQWGLYHYFKFHLKDLEKDHFQKNYYRFIKYLLEKLKNIISEEINFQKT